MDYKSFAVVTGAGKGLGRAFALELGRQKKNVILVSLPGENLNELANQIKQENNVETIPFEVDISDYNALEELAKTINNHYSVDLLINNAGIGGSRPFDHVDTNYILKIIQVNVVATSTFTHMLLPNLKQQPKSHILNVSSLAAFSPTGFKTVYPASKAFVHSFSRGLYQELKETNIFVSVVNPGAMATNEEVSSRIKKQGLIGRLTLLDPDKVAKKCLRQLKKRDTVIMVNPITWLISSITPIWIKLPIMTNIVKREITYADSICNGR